MGWGYTSGRRGSKQEVLLEWNYLVLVGAVPLTAPYLLGESKQVFSNNHKPQDQRCQGWRTAPLFYR